MCEETFVQVSVCILYGFFLVHFHTHMPVCMCACTCTCVHIALTASGVLAIRKTTSGKVHINHFPQLKERNRVEMGGGGGRIMRGKGV